MLNNRQRRMKKRAKRQRVGEDKARIERTLQLLQHRLPKVEQKQLPFTGSQTSLSWNGALQSPNGINQGTGESNRVGSSVVYTHQKLRSQFSWNPSSTNANGTTTYQQIRLILFFQVPTISAPSTATMSNYLLNTPQLPDSINSMYGQQYRQDFVILADRTARVSGSEPVARIDLEYRMNQTVHWVGGSTTNLAHGLQWLVLTDVTPLQVNFPYQYWCDLLT